MILIDAKMPDNCVGCGFYHDGLEFCMIGSCSIPSRHGYDPSVKPNWCPIKAEIPDDAKNSDITRIFRIASATH